MHCFAVIHLPDHSRDLSGDFDPHVDVGRVSHHDVDRDFAEVSTDHGLALVGFCPELPLMTFAIWTPLRSRAVSCQTCFGILPFLFVCAAEGGQEPSDRAQTTSVEAVSTLSSARFQISFGRFWQRLSRNTNVCRFGQLRRVPR